MSNKDGGPAFPQPMTASGNGQHIEFQNTPGMTLRDYFAAKAMQGLAANPDLMRSVVSRINQNQVADFYAGMAHQLADAMLAARKETR